MAPSGRTTPETMTKLPPSEGPTEATSGATDQVSRTGREARIQHPGRGDQATPPRRPTTPGHRTAQPAPSDVDVTHLVEDLDWINRAVGIRSHEHGA